MEPEITAAVALPMNLPLTPALSRSDGERVVPEVRDGVRGGFRGPLREWLHGILLPPTWVTPITSRPELLLLAAALALFNLPLLHGQVFASLVFVPAGVADGEWWRLITHPFVHVSWYHLLLDGVAFFLLYQDLAEPRRAARLGCVAAAGVGSLLVAWGAGGGVAGQGLCGLSGIAHGLMAITALELTATGRTRSDRGWGVVAFALVVAKSAWEAISGQAFLSWLHFGLMGSPIAVSHAGGVLGGLLAWRFTSPARSAVPTGRPSPCPA